jgi:hypothetical protein
LDSKLPDSGDFILYATDDGEAKLQVRMVDETMWLSIDQMAELFQRSKSVISRHVSNVFSEGELDQNRTVAKYATVQFEGSREVQRTISYYNLDVIISVGYRVKSLRGTQFRIWATRQLREYIVKGFVLNDERFKNSADNDYFEELLGRIRDIRASEKSSTRRSSISLRPALITTNQHPRHNGFSHSSRTSCIGLRMAILLPKWCMTAPMQQSRIWV